MNRLEMVRQAQRIRDSVCERFPEYADYLKPVYFEVNNRFTRRLADANRVYGRIRLSGVFFGDPRNYHAFEDTVLHELAHILNRSGGSAHGFEWRAIARKIGCDGKRLSRGTVRPIPKKIFLAPCGVCNKNMRLGPIQYRRYVQAGRKGYHHKRCVPAAWEQQK
jgi:predicted SprT family Zn-dependent metalloprotease